MFVRYGKTNIKFVYSALKHTSVQKHDIDFFIKYYQSVSSSMRFILRSFNHQIDARITLLSHTDVDTY